MARVAAGQRAVGQGAAHDRLHDGVAAPRTRPLDNVVETTLSATGPHLSDSFVLMEERNSLQLRSDVELPEDRTDLSTHRRDRYDKLVGDRLGPASSSKSLEDGPL